MTKSTLQNNFIVPTIAVQSSSGKSVFATIEIGKELMSGRMLSPQLPTINMRIRESDNTYSSDYHIAGDPTFIAVLQGCMRIFLQNGEYRDFAAGATYIAADFLLDGVQFNNKIHGHRAKVLGNEIYRALHIKLPNSYRQIV